MLAWVGEPVDVLALLFCGFKVLQGAVFVGWCYLHGNGSLWPPSTSVWSFVAGGALIAAGQLLNVSVFYRLGKVGVFYGNKFGYHVPWHHEFPFSFFKHPQYVGALFSIWGFFLVMRFPQGDWYLVPILETIYYVLAAYYERQPGGSRITDNSIGAVIESRRSINVEFTIASSDRHNEGAK